MNGTLGFVCPDCGGYKFGTSNCCSSVEDWVRQCHGDDYRSGCGFEWSIADDEKYGLID